MRLTNYLPLSIFMLCAAIFSSCSGGGGVIPDEQNVLPQKYDCLSPLVSDYDANGNPSAGWGILGLFDVHFDSLKSDISMISLRNGALYDTLEVVDITNFMTLAPCTDCAKVESFQLNSDDTVSLNISIRHPFEVGDPLKPITGRNRADLHVFNVEGLVVASSGTEKSVDFPGLGETVGNSKLINAEGMSGYLDTSLDSIFDTQATVHPYKLHFRDYGTGNFDPSSATGFSDILHPSGNLVMAMGCEPDVREYKFALEGADRLDFYFAVGCTYAVSAANKSMRFNPEYRVPQHNKKSASEVHVEIASNNLMGGIPTSDCKLNVKVLDMSHGVVVGESLDQMHAQSDVGSISVEVPGVTSSPVTLVSPTPISGTNRDPDNPLLYEITFTNSASGSQGDYPGLVKVTDTYAPGQNSAPLLNSKDGIKRVSPVENPLTGLFDIAEFATYAVFEVEVMPATDPPVCDIQTVPSNATVGINRDITLDGSGSYDTDGTIETYEWDFDYDGVTFNVDDTGAVVVTQYSSEGDRDAALRVTDDMNARVICTVVVHVTTQTIPDDFVKIDDDHIGQNVTIVEDYNGYLHAFYGKSATDTDQTSNIYQAYSTDQGNTWQGHVELYATTSLDDFHVVVGQYSQMVSAFATDGPTIYIAWLEQDWLPPSQWQERIMAGEVDISNLNSPTLNYVEVHKGAIQYAYPSPQIIALSDNKIMMYYMEYRGTGWFEPAYKFCYFNQLSDSITPTRFFYPNTINGEMVYVYNSSSPILVSDSHDNILFTISGRFWGINNITPPTVPFPPYDSGYGSAILRYNFSGDYNTGDNWTFVQHYGCLGSQYYWDNWTQAICIDENDSVHWVFEYEINGWPDSSLYGDYYLVYGTGPSTGYFDFDYKDPIHPDMHDNGASDIAEFRFASIDTNSQGEVWITYQDALTKPEIYYTWSDDPLVTWQTPVQMTVPPMDQAWYPYMFISSWDAMYVVVSDAASNGYPWVRAIDTL